MTQTYPTPNQKQLSQLGADVDIHQFHEVVHHDDDDADLYHFDKAIEVKRILQEKQLQAWVTVESGIQTPVCQQVTRAYITDNCGTILVESADMTDKYLTEMDICAIFNELASSIEQKRYTVVIERLTDGRAFDTYEVMTRDWHAFAAISYCFFDAIDGINNEAGDLTPSSVEQKLRMASLGVRMAHMPATDFIVAVDDGVDYRMVSVDITKA